MARGSLVRFLHVGTCSVCVQGSIGIRVAASGQVVVGLCDECDAVWLDPALTDGPYCPEQPELPCPGHGSPLRSPPAHWADEAEAAAAGWWEAVVGESVHWERSTPKTSPHH